MTVKEKTGMETAIVTEWDGTEDMVFYEETEEGLIKMVYIEGTKQTTQTVTKEYFERRLNAVPVRVLYH